MKGPQGPRLILLPGLDGLRGLAVVAVVLYHMGFERVRGGYLGVSTFFTLSGFLITSLLLNELTREGRASLRRFWERRFRRLMPAALATLFLVTVVFGRTVATADQRLALRWDVISSLFYVANWRFVLTGTTYGDPSGPSSPVLHFWSLSIEEQFYIVFPLFLVGTWMVASRLRRRRSVVLVAVFAGLTLAASLQPWLFGLSTNSAYLGSTVRAGEMLTGGILAVVLSHRSVRRAIAIRVVPRTALMVAAGVAAVIQVYWISTVDQTTEWLYRGGLTLFGLMTTVIITAVALPIGPARFVAGAPVLRWFGTRSYGIYLFHWPLLLAARQTLTTVPDTLRATVAVIVALGLAEVSFRYLEMPVRLHRWPIDHRARRTAVGGFVIVAITAMVPIPIDRTQLRTDFEAAQRELGALDGKVTPSTSTPPSTAGGASNPTVPTSTVPAPPTPATLTIFGDSTALLVSLGLVGSISDGTTTQFAYVPGVTVLGCGISRFDAHLFFGVGDVHKCHNWPTEWANVVSEYSPDLALVITGAWEVLNVRLPGSKTWTSIGDPATDDFIRSEIDAAIDVVTADGALAVLWLWPPYAPWASDNGRSAIARQHDPARMERLHELMRDVAAAHPQTVRLFDLGEYLGAQRLADQTIRPDGHHIPTEAMQGLFATGLSERLHDIYTDWWESEHR